MRHHHFYSLEQTLPREIPRRPRRLGVAGRGGDGLGTVWWRCAPFLLLAALLLAAGTAAGNGELATARAALDDGLPDVAERHLVRYLAHNQGDPQACVPALVWLCQALAAQGRAVDLLGLLDANPTIVAAGQGEGAFIFWRARALLDLGRGGEILDVMRGADLERMSPDYATGLLRLVARARMAVGDYTGAREAFARVDRMAADRLVRAENLLEWAQADLALGLTEECEARLARQTELAATNMALPSMALGSLLRAQVIRRGGRGKEAGALLRRLAEDEATPPDSRAEAWLELAAMAAAEGRTNEVRDAGFQILHRGVSPLQSWRLRMRYGNILIALPGLVPEGAALLQRVIREQPGAAESAVSQQRLGDAWLMIGSNAQAAVEYRNYLETYGVESRVAALRGQAIALSRLGSHAEAATTFQKAADAATNQATRTECLLKAADAFHAAGRHEQAAVIYDGIARAAVTNSPAAAAAAGFMAADALERMGRAAAAEESFARLAEETVAPVADDAMLRLARLLEAREAGGEAIAAYGSVIERTTNSLQRGMALLGRGRTHYRNYQFEEAIPDLESVARAGSPELTAEASYLGMLSLYGAGRDEEAAALGESFAGQHAGSPRAADAALWMAQYHYNRGDHEEAQRRFTDFADRWPEHAMADAALVGAARAALQRSEFAVAIALLARLPREYPGSSRKAEARFLQADALCELARFEDAILVFDEIINRYPDSESVTASWMRKGDSLFALGSSSTNRYQEAMQSYAGAMARHEATPEQVLQSSFKQGRCLEKLGRLDEAIDQYYGQVMVRYQRDRDAGVFFSGDAQEWVTRAAMQAAAIRETQGQSRAAVGILKRLIRSGAPGAAEAETLIGQIRERQPIRWPSEADRNGDDDGL